VPDITAAMTDDDRFRVLFDEHRRTVLGYALRRTDEPADAADVLAETFLVAWRRIGDVPAGDDARPWLLGVARRVLANHRRGTRRRLGLAERLGRQLDVAVPPPEPMEPALARALQRLSEGDREILLLSAWEGLEPSEIAAVTGQRAVTVRSRLHRARARLRAELDPPCTVLPQEHTA
jgi:RNA polymerase sigma-70 factor (ECF subfamily)